jgi:signal peptidase I
MSTESMLPTIDVGSHIVIDKSPDFLTYGDIIITEYDVVIEGDLLDHEIKGPVVSRIVGLPGDSLAIENDFCIINGKKNPYKLIRKGTQNEHVILKDEIVEYVETFPNGLAVGVYRYYVEGHDYVYFRNEKPNMSAIKIPENHYFLMGDFRTNALDSRYVGAMPRDKILGKVVKIKPPKIND